MHAFTQTHTYGYPSRSLYEDSTNINDEKKAEKENEESEREWKKEKRRSPLHDFVDSDCQKERNTLKAHRQRTLGSLRTLKKDHI